MTSHRTSWTGAGLALVMILGSEPLGAQVQVEKRRAAAEDGAVYVENSFGSVVVRGWDQAEVLVKGRLAAGAEGLDFGGDEGTYVEVDEPSTGSTHLETTATSKAPSRSSFPPGRGSRSRPSTLRSRSSG